MKSGKILLCEDLVHIFQINIFDMPFQFIYFNEKILGGKPIIKGSRISVEFVME